MNNNLLENYNIIAFDFIKNKILTDSDFFLKLNQHINLFENSIFKPKNFIFWKNLLAQGSEKTLNFIADKSNYSMDIKKNNPFLSFINIDDKGLILKTLLKKRKKINFFKRLINFFN